MIRQHLIVVLLLLLPLVSVADDALVYESFMGVSIGRVFLTQQERELLDARRLLSSQDGDNEASSSTSDDSNGKPLASAGYIIGRNGRSKIWRDGDFVESRGNAANSMSFPGDVKITRRIAVDESAAANKDDKARRPSGPDGDAD